MAKTTNHPPYEIDPWKADTTEPPSGLTFNPEIVETADKPKQAPVPAEPTEGQLKIEEAISRQDQFHNDMAALKKEQEAILEQVQESIDETNEKIKQLNNLEEQIKKQVGEYTEETDEKLRQAELLRGELQESKAKMEKAVNDASSAITAAEKAQKALDAYKNGESQRIKDAIVKAQEGVAKAAEVNKQISDLKNSLGGEINKQISSNDTIAKIKADNQALSGKLDDALKTSKQGVDDAAKAIKAIENNVEIGASLITVMPGTTRPYWTKDLSVGEEGTKDEYFYSDSFEVGIDGPLVKINPKLEYRLYLETYGYDGESKITITFVDKDGKDVSIRVISYEEKNGKKERVVKAGFTQFPLYDEILTPTWKSIDYAIEFLGGVEFVKLGRIRFNAYSKEKKKQCIRNFRIEPLIPTQADVDRAQNKAIEANSLALEQQKDINKQNKEFQNLQKDFNTSQTKLNKTYDAMWDAQGKRNLLQEGIDSAQTKAIKSLSKLDAGTSLIGYYEPTDEEVQKGNARYDLPEWGEYLADKRYESSDGYPGLPPGEDFAYGVSSSTGTKNRFLPYRPVIPETTYTLSFWAKGSGNIVVYMYGDGQRSYPVTTVRQLKVNQETLAEERDKDGKRIYEPNGNGNRISSKGTQWLLSGFVFPEEWTYFSYEVTFLASTRNVRLSHFYWNWNIKSSKGQYFSGMTFTPDIPSQAQIDQSQNEAIKANTLALENQKAINDKQSGIAAAHTKAIDSNRKAIRALAKIDLGGSLLAYMPLTDAEIQKGITREYVPAWAANAANVLDGNKLSGTDSARGYVFLGASGGSAKGEEVYAQVSPGTQYLFEIDIFSPVNTSVGFRLNCSNSKIDRPVKKFMWLEKDKYGGYKVTRSTLNNRTLTISSSDTYQNGYRYLVEFKEGVEDIYVEQVTWTNSTSITVKSISFAPYTPSQAAIDARQEETLERLKKFDTEQVKVNDRIDDAIAMIHRTAAGVMFMPRETIRASNPHGVAAKMPYRDRYLELYSNTSFKGNVTIVVNYSNGNTQVLNEEFNRDYTTESAANYHSNVKAISDKHNRVKFKKVQLPLGDVNNIYLLMDPTEWSYV